VIACECSWRFPTVGWRAKTPEIRDVKFVVFLDLPRDISKLN
jgi:hypothetical protein